jgi:hypothetical protein
MMLAVVYFSFLPFGFFNIEGGGHARRAAAIRCDYILYMNRTTALEPGRIDEFLDPPILDADGATYIYLRMALT